MSDQQSAISYQRSAVSGQLESHPLGLAEHQWQRKHRPEMCGFLGSPYGANPSTGRSCAWHKAGRTSEASRATGSRPRHLCFLHITSPLGERPEGVVRRDARDRPTRQEVASGRRGPQSLRSAGLGCAIRGVILFGYFLLKKKERWGGGGGGAPPK